MSDKGGFVKHMVKNYIIKIHEVVKHIEESGAKQNHQFFDLNLSHVMLAMSHSYILKYLYTVVMFSIKINVYSVLYERGHRKH